MAYRPLQQLGAEGGYSGAGRAQIVAPQAPQARLPRAAAALTSFGGQPTANASSGLQPDWSGGAANNGGLEDNPWPLATESYRPKSPTGPIGPPQRERARSPISAKPSLGTPKNCVLTDEGHTFLTRLLQ